MNPYLQHAQGGEREMRSGVFLMDAHTGHVRERSSRVRKQNAFDHVMLGCHR